MAKLPKNASWCLVHQYTTFKTYYNNCKPLQITFTSHLIRYTLLVLGWNTFQNICHRFNKKLQTLLTDYDHRHDSTTQLLQICRLHLHDTNVPSHCIPKCSIGLRSGFSGGRLNKVNALYSGYNPSRTAVLEILSSACLTPTTVPRSRSPFWCSVWPLCDWFVPNELLFFNTADPIHFNYASFNNNILIS